MNTTTTAPGTATAVTITYASFGARLVALIIDVIVIGVVQGVVITPLLTVMGLSIASDIQNSGGTLDDAQAIGMIGTIFAAMGSIMLISGAISILYYALLESSKTQASLGKMALGIKVTDLNGERISFGKAALRSIGKLLSGYIMCIGYLIAAFTEKKQALHDLIASTLVIKK
jgi:uncharacterized RDD family membrane protein YckC